MIKLILGVCIATIVGLVAFAFVPKASSGEQNNIQQNGDNGNGDKNKLTIGITGEVVKPGNYLLDEGATLEDLIEKAGGTNNNADERCYYIDTPIKKNQEYYIAPKYDLKDVCGDTPLKKVNINEADKETLMTVDGFGDAVTTQLLKYRADNGVFYTLESIMEVNGIGNATFSKVKDYIYLHD